MTLATERATQLYKAKEALTRINGLFSRIMALPVDDMDALERLSLLAQGNAGELEQALSALWNNATTAQFDAYEAAYREQRLNGLRMAEAGFSIVNFSAQGSSL